MRRSIHFTLLLTAAGLCSSLFGQTTPHEFGNWLSAYGSTLRIYQATPGLPMGHEFTVLAGNNLIPMYVDTDLSTGYLASIIPTPGLTSASVCGTAGVRCPSDSGNLTSVRCAADAHFASTGQGEALNQSRPGYTPELRVPYRANAVTTSRPPLPTFRMLPFPSAYPGLVVKPPLPDCDTLHDDPLLVVNHQSASVSVYGSCSGTLIKKIQVTSNPLQVEVLPDSSQAIVTSFDGAITFIDLSTYTVTGALLTSSYYPSGIAVSPDGTRAYVTSLNDPGALLTIDTQKRQILQTLPLTGYSQSVFLTPDGSLAWITFPLDNKVVVVDTLTNTIVKTLSAQTPTAMAFNSTGTLAFVAQGKPGTVAVLNTTTYQIVQNINVGRSPDEIGIGPDDTFAVVTNYDGLSVTVINLNGYATFTFSLPAAPMGLSIRY